MNLSDFDYALPPELIAQTPAPERDESRMLVLDRRRGAILHDRRFRDFPSFLSPGDVVVVNDSRVIPARLCGRKSTGARIEILLLRRHSRIDASRECWDVLLKPAKRTRQGMTVAVPGDALVTIEQRLTDKTWRMSLTAPDVEAFLEAHGRAPLPPYIHRRSGDREGAYDRERYQTIYARIPGSIAAPTAGLHFTPRVLSELRTGGIDLQKITLHVGHGTFRPIESEIVEDHVMDREWYEIREDAVCAIRQARRVVAVGTTVTRVIESATDETGRTSSREEKTNLFIYPGYRFRRTDALLTNFHLPRSSLFLLVCAFAGTDLVKEAYRQAVERRYRFYSYGDCMLIL